MEAAPSAKPPPVPPNYVSLRHLQELRLKEKEEQERRRREEEEAAAAKREAAMKAEAKRRAASWEASGGARERERHRGGKAQGQGNQRVAVAHRAPASNQRPAGKWEAAIGGGRGETGPDDAPHGGGNPRVKGKWKGKGKGKEKLAEAPPAPPHGGKPAEVVPASPYGGKPENKSESSSKAKGKAPGNQAAESSFIVGPGEPAEAAILSSRDRSRRGRPAGAGGRSGAETCTGIAPVKTAGPSPAQGVKSDDTGKANPPAPMRADAAASGDLPDGRKAGPAQVPPADGSSKPTSGGELLRAMEAKPGGLVEGQRRRPVVQAQAVAAELNPRVARCSAAPLRGRGNESAQQHGRVWVPKAAAVAGSPAGAGL